MRRTPKAQELRDQVRADIQQAREVQAAPLPLAPGCILLATPHVPTPVHVDDIDTVMVLPKANPLGLRGLVTLLDGARHFVPTADDVLRAIREVRR